MNIWLIAVCLLLTLRSYAQTPFTVTLESPGIANQVSPLVVNGQAYGAYGVIEQAFDSLRTGNNTNVPLGTVGTYSQINVVKANVFGGAGGTGNYVSVGTIPVTITFTTPQRYFGLWWSAGDPRNVLKFYSGNTLVQTFTTADVVNFINNLPAGQRSQYFGNPNNNFKGGDSGEPFAFINFFADPSNQGVTFNKIELSQAPGGGFESDNHTIAASYTSITGMQIDPEPIDPLPGDTVDVGSGGNVDSKLPAIIGNDSTLKVDSDGEMMDTALVMVEAGGELMGSGIVETPMLVNDGTLDSTGSGMTINGTLMDMPSSETIIASSSSEIKVNGKADLGGELVLDIAPKVGLSEIVLYANKGISGEFSKVVDPLNSKNLTDVTIYAKNGVDEVFLPPGEGEISLKTSMPVGAKNLVVFSLDPTAEQLTSLFEIGFSGANTQRFKLDERFDGIQRGSTGFVSNLAPAPASVTTTATGKETAAKQAVLPPSPAKNRWGMWANGWGDWVSVSNDGSAQGYNFTTGGFIIGVDYRITDHFAVGVMGSYAHTDTNLQPSGDVDVSTGRGGLYATYFDYGFYINAAGYGGYNSYSTSRQALLGMANGSTNSGEFSIWTESGYDFHFGDFTVGPMGALQYTLVDVDGFSEQGSLLPLHIQSNQETSLRTDLGARASYTWHLGNVLVTPTLTVAWEHEYFYSDLPITVSSVDFPGQSATLYGPSEGHDGAIINTGAAFQFTPRLSTYLGYQGQLGRDHYNANAITGGFSFSF
jgi:outer membrane autotransporter protein